MELFEPVIRFFWEGSWPAGVVEPRRQLFDCELVYLTAGAFTLEIAGSTHAMQPGMVALIPPACRHESRVPDGGRRATRHCVHFDWRPEPARPPAPLFAWDSDGFDPRLAVMPPPEIAASLPLVAAASAVRPVSGLLEEMLARLRCGDRTADLLLWPILRHLLAGTATIAPTRTRMGKSVKAALLLKHVLDLRFGEPLGYAEMQAASGLSKCHLCTVFRKVVGRPPLEYLAEVRLAQARRLLEAGTHTVAEVARASGFSSPNYFARRFRRRFGCPPSAIGPATFR